MTESASWNSDINVTVSLDTPALSRAGFTTLLILGSTTAGFAAGEVKSYSNPPTAAEAAELGATLTAMLNTAFQQTIRPALVKVGNLATYDTTGLDQVLAFDGDWFGLVVESVTAADLLEVSAWIETHRRLFFAQSADAGIIAAAYNPAGAGVGDVFKAQNRAYTSLIFHETASEYAAVAAAANRLSVDPDVQTTVWRHFSLVGVTQQSLTETEKQNLISKNGNVYLPFFGTAVFGPGRMSEGASGRPIDERVTAEWTRSRVSEAIATLLLNTSTRGEKLPYDDDGFQAVRNAVMAVLEQGVSVGHFTAADPADAPIVTVPLLADVPAADVSARIVRPTFYARLAGAIEQAAITGFATLDLSGVV